MVANTGTDNNTHSSTTSPITTDESNTHHNNSTTTTTNKTTNITTNTATNTENKDSSNLYPTIEYSNNNENTNNNDGNSTTNLQELTESKPNNDNQKQKQEQEDLQMAEALQNEEFADQQQLQQQSIYSTTSETTSTARTRDIWFKGKHRKILLQNENGPCPLLAICNILILRGKASIHPDYSIVPFSYLTELVADHIMESKPPEGSGYLLNHEQNISDAISLLPKLQEGLDINVRFTSPDAMEYTKECVVFDLLNINIYHGWIVDPQDSHVYQVINGLSYNHLMERLVEYETTITPNNNDSSNVNHETKELSNDNNTDNNNNNNNGNNEDDKNNDKEQDTNKDKEKIIQEGGIISQFLDQTASQLTYEGLCQIHNIVKEGELCVFFRNNHFSTIHKHNGRLYLLVTDEGFLNEESVVWEELAEIGGDNIFCDSSFRPLSGQTLETLPSSSNNNNINNNTNDNSTNKQELDDFEIAQRLQEEENRNAAAASSNSHSNTTAPRTNGSNSNTQQEPSSTGQQHKSKSKRKKKNETPYFNDPAKRAKHQGQKLNQLHQERLERNSQQHQTESRGARRRRNHQGDDCTLL